MKRKPTHTPAALHLPADWDDATAPSANRDAAPPPPDALDEADDTKDADNGYTARMQAMCASAPPTLVKAMFALNRAKSEDDIAAARAILRVASF